LGSGHFKCCHNFCTQCIQGTIKWNPMNPRCPFDNAPISVQNCCGVMTSAQFVSWEKQRRAQLTGSSPCSLPHCVGVVRVVAAQLPVQSTCDRCATAHCGRRQCGAPWVVGHRCPDIVAAEQAAERAAEQAAARQWGSDFQPGIDSAPQFQMCPSCGVAVERDGGCNMMRHARCNGGCGAEWCWICGRVGTCSDFNCRARDGEYRHPMNNDTAICRTSAKSAALCTVQPRTKAFEVDPALPVTRVRITLHDGQRRELQTNEDHTIGDLCDYCSLLAGGIPMMILSGFPLQVQTDRSKTLREAGILNSAVTVRPVGASNGCTS